MPTPRLQQSQQLKGTQTHKLIHRLKLARIMELPENEFSALVNQIENDPLYKRFHCADAPEHRLFGHRRFPHSRWSENYLELNENISASTDTGDLSAFFEDKKEIIEICKKIGVDNFESYFLYNDGTNSVRDIADVCGLSEVEVRKAMDLVNHVSAQEEFLSAPAPGPATHQHFSRVAAFEKQDNGQIEVAYHSLRYARGRYAIDYNRLPLLAKDRRVSSADLRALKELIKTMELVNTRKATVCLILEKLADQQKEFLASRQHEHLKALSQIEMARQLGLHSSTISRAVANRSVVTPWNEEIPLKGLLVKGPVYQLKAALQRLVNREEIPTDEGPLPRPLRDDELRDLLREELGVPIATRTVAKYRTELGIENVYRRTQEWSTKRPLRGGAASREPLLSESDKSSIPTPPTPRRSPSA